MEREITTKTRTRRMERGTGRGAVTGTRAIGLRGSV